MQGSIRKRVAGIIRIAPRNLAKAQRDVEAHRLLIREIDFEGQRPRLINGMGNQQTPNAHSLPVRGNEYPADKTAQQADEANGLTRMASNPCLCFWEVFLLDELALLRKSLLPNKRMRQQRRAKPDFREISGVRSRIKGPDSQFFSRHVNSTAVMR